MQRFRTVKLGLAAIALAAAVVAPAALAVHAQQPSGEPLFITASVDNDRPYLGQQITYILKVSRRADFHTSAESQYEPPGFAGFWNNWAIEQEKYNETIGPNQYGVVERRTVLFPTVVGTIVIEPASLTTRDATSGSSIALETAPVALDVRPLPAGAPPGFTGGVGRFDIAAEVDTTTGQVNEPVQLTVRVSGEGNIEALPHPALPTFVGWRVIAAPPAADSQLVAGRLTGRRTYEFVLIPEKAGALTIPEIGYTYYDPHREQYVPAATAPIAMSITDAAGPLTPAPSPDVGAAVEQTGADLRPLKAVPPALRQSGRELTGSVVYWAAWGLPLLVIVGAVVWRRRQVTLEAARASSRRQNALANAETALARAVASGDDPRVAAAAAMLSYLADRIETPVGGLTGEALSRRLQDSGTPPDLADQVSDTLAAGEAAEYTPAAVSTGEPADYVQRTTQLLTDLEGAIAA